MSDEMSERRARMIMWLRKTFTGADTVDLANFATARLEEKVTEAQVVEVLAACGDSHD